MWTKFVDLLNCDSSFYNHQICFHLWEYDQNAYLIQTVLTYATKKNSHSTLRDLKPLIFKWMVSITLNTMRQNQPNCKTFYRIQPIIFRTLWCHDSSLTFFQFYATLEFRFSLILCTSNFQMWCDFEYAFFNFRDENMDLMMNLLYI